MRRFAVRNLTTHAGSQCKTSAIGKRGLEFALHTKHYVPFGTPMIGGIAGRVFDHPHANLARILGSPEGGAGLTGMFGRRDLSPVRNRMRKAGHLHETSIARSFKARTAPNRLRSKKRRRAGLLLLAHVIYTYGLP
jgi:hypothetical protein